MSKKFTVAILYGGKSVEHQISLRSAKNVFDNIDRSKFEPLLIGIDLNGNWYQLHEFRNEIQDGDPVMMQLRQDNRVFFNMKENKNLGPVDIVFPVIHGNDGEDGSIQGLFKTLNIPVVGSGVTGSALAMDKVLSKKIMRDAGIKVSRFRHYFIEEKDSIRFEDVTADLGLPLIIKPVSSGSSVGVSKIKSREEFFMALDDTFQYDNEIIFEEFIAGREMECAVIGNRQPVASLPGEVLVASHHDFYSFEAKYVDDDGASLEMPARVPEDVVKRIHETVIKAYIALKCEDYSRVDFFLTPAGEIIINEINTIPGFTDISMFPQLWKISGIAYPDLVTRLIEEALQKHARNERLKRSFDSKL
ncbi:MAG TPA: D-alanine--D-alanine ligase family protein [Cyclobacteriaceae bacterium]|nr:D-alanine--D-alanine ligase family protein [Cyclobacteriaceae bacterium]